MPDRLQPHHTHQMLDLQALFTPITKGSFKLQPAGARQTVQTALDLAVSGRPGPVHLQLSNEDAGQWAVPDSNPANRQPGGSAPVQPLTGARDLLARSRRPVIVAGLGLEPEKPYEALRKLAEAASAPVITTPKAKGSLSEDHPLAAGVIGLTRTDPAYQLLDEADCIMAVGFDVVELVKPWDQAAPLIWIAPWPNEDPRLPAQVEYVGLVQPCLHELAGAAPAVSPGWGAARVAALRQVVARQPLPAPAPGRLRPQSVLEIVRQNVPRDSLLATDVGSHKILAGLAWPAYAPNSYLVSNGLSSMGFAVPAAVAASLALPGRTVICFTGDAGLAMMMGELGLLARLQTPVVVVVFNDGALDLIRSQQVRAGKPVYGTEFSNPDFIQLAQAYHLDAYQVRDEQVCASAIQAGLARARPTLIEAVIDPASYPTTPSASGG
jgi:acetolactate synthase-1/2/3 large subunit